MTRCFKKHLAPSYAAHACKVHRVNKFGKELFRMVLWAVSFYLLLGTRPLAVSFCIKFDKRLMKPTLSSVFFFIQNSALDNFGKILIGNALLSVFSSSNLLHQFTLLVHKLILFKIPFASFQNVLFFFHKLNTTSH